VSLGKAVTLCGDARRLLLPDESVDLIVTSPPYFGLRSYQDGGEHYDGQIGAEASPAEYAAELLECTREWVRLLKPEGSLWVNLGDKYRDKSLIGLPWRYALGCIDDLGLILRAEVIWSKPNGLPESVKDRVRRSHETWFHLVKSPRYFAAVDEVREAHDPQVQAHVSRYTGRNYGKTNTDRGDLGQSNFVGNPLGKLPGSVWQIATQPLRVPAELAVDHFAAFPMEWPRRIISGWSPSGVCTACGEGRRPIADHSEKFLHRPGAANLVGQAWKNDSGDGNARHDIGNVRTVHRITGYACACPDTSAPTRPAVVLDPFGGTGTTALVADVLGRHGISVDMSADYCRLAEWRVNDPKQRARVLGKQKRKASGRGVT
jgi:DNA modification methylase